MLIWTKSDQKNEVHWQHLRGGRQVLITARITWTVCEWKNSNSEARGGYGHRLKTLICVHRHALQHSQHARVDLDGGWLHVAQGSKGERGHIWQWHVMTLSVCVLTFSSWPNSKAVRFKIIIISSCVLHPLCTWENGEKLMPSHFFVQQCKTKWYSIYY